MNHKFNLVIRDAMRKVSVNEMNKGSILKLLFIVTTFGLLLYRVSLHADHYDEIINLSISYRIALGDIPFYNGWEAFQSGDIFMAPFLWIYIKLFQTTSGMILYARFVYILVLIFLALWCYGAIKRYMGRTNAFFLSYIIVFFQVYSLFYLWYDTVSIIFFCFGVITLLRAFQAETAIKHSCLMILAGVFHCFMAFSYPAFALLAIFLAVIVFYNSYRMNEKSIKSAFFDTFLYGVGAIFFVSVLLIYAQLAIGISDVFDTISIITSSRGTNRSSLLNIISDIVVSYVRVNKFFVPLTIVLGILYFRGLRDRRYRKSFFCALIILPVLNQIFLEKSTVMGLANYLSYLMLWCPFVYFMKKSKKKIDRLIFSFFYLPSVLSAICISLTTVYSEMGPIKCWQTCLMGALATLYFIIDILRSYKHSMKFDWQMLLPQIIVIALLFNAYSYIYLNQQYIRYGDERVADGLFWGIKVNESMAENIELQNLVIANSKGCETVLAGSALRTIYLMTDMRPFVWSVESPAYMKDGQVQWDYAIKYFDYFDEYPDIMFLEEWEIQNDDIQKILKNKYDLTDVVSVCGMDVHIYKKDKVR